MRFLFYFKLVGFTLVFFAFSTAALAKHGQSSKRLVCFFYDKTRPHEHMGMMHPGLPFVFAKGLFGEDIFVSGSMKDGFFYADGLEGRAIGNLSAHVNKYYENSEPMALKFCERGLRHVFGKIYRDKQFIHHGVKSSRLSAVHHPLVFTNHQRPHLAKINKMIVFGDSLSDTGNLKTGLRIFPTKPHFAGRFSDREIWLDYLQRVTGMAIQNWAYAGSVANPILRANHSDKPFKERMWRRVQAHASGHIDREINRFARRALKRKPMVAGDSTLISLWIGANDYLPYIEANSDSDVFFDEPDNQEIGFHVVANIVTDKIIGQIRRLYALGGRNFLIPNIPDLGQAPRLLKNTSYHANAGEDHNSRMFKLSTNVTNLINFHNQSLQNKLIALSNELPDAQIVFADAAKNEMHVRGSISFEDGLSQFNYDLDHQAALSFTQNTQTISIYLPCYQGKSLLSRHGGAICAQPHRAPYWDDIHPTTYGHCLIAAYFHQEISRTGLLRPTRMAEYLRLCRDGSENLNRFMHP